MAVILISLGNQKNGELRIKYKNDEKLCFFLVLKDSIWCRLITGYGACMKLHEIKYMMFVAEGM